MSFLLYKAKDNDNVIGYLQSTIPTQGLAEDGKTPVIFIQLVIAWCAFDPETGEVGPTPEGWPSTTIETPIAVECLGSEDEFLSNFDADDGDGAEPDDEQPTAAQ